MNWLDYLLVAWASLLCLVMYKSDAIKAWLVEHDRKHINRKYGK